MKSRKHNRSNFNVLALFAGFELAQEPVNVSRRNAPPRRAIIRRTRRNEKRSRQNRRRTKPEPAREVEPKVSRAEMRPAEDTMAGRAGSQ
jgi:hypothetical protein